MQGISFLTFAIGTALGAMLLSLGVGLGWLAARRWSSGETVPTHDLLRMLGKLANWSQEFVTEASEYHTVVKQLAGEIQGTPGTGRFTELVSRLVNTNNEHARRLADAEQAIRQQSDQIQSYLSEARTDVLTALPNRRAFNDEIARRLSEWQRLKRPFAVLLLDIDFFKTFNDCYGHLAGDAVLAECAQVLRGTFRDSDVVARYGGEEFAVVAPASGVSETALAADRARRAVEEHIFYYEDQPLRVTVSCGLAQVQLDESTTNLLKRADSALYASKNGGRNCVHWHDGLRCLRLGGELGGRGGSVSIAPKVPEKYGEVCANLRRRLTEITGA